MQVDSLRPPLPPFTFEDAVIKVRKAEDAWNGKRPESIALAYSTNSLWVLRSGTHESNRERVHLCLLPCPTGHEAGDDARFIIDDEAYDSLNVTKIQRAIIEQCDSVSSDTTQ